MKAIFPGLPLLDAAGKELGESQANGDTQDAVQGFDALLALVAAQSATAAQQQQPVKPLAPSVGAQAPTTAPNPSCVKAQASAPLELMAPQVDAAMYSIQGALFATALEHAGVTLPAHDELMPLETQALEGALIDAQAPSVVQPSAAQMAPTPDVAQPIVAPAHATSEPASQPALHAAPTDGSSAVAAPLTVAQPQANAPTLPSTPRGEVEQLEAATPAADAAPANAPGKDAPVAEGHAAAQPAQTNAPDAAPRAPESRAHPEREVAEAESNAVSTTPVLATPLEPSRPAVDTRTAPQPSPVELLEPAPHAAVAPEARPVAAPPVPAPEQLPLPVETSAQPSAAPVAAAPVAPGVQGVPQPAHTPAQHAASAGAPAPDATRGVVDAVELSGPPLQIHARAARHDAPALEAQATESEPESEGAREQRAADATQPAASQQPLMAPAMPAPAAQPASGPQVSSAKAPPRPAAPAQPALDSADATASLVGMRDNQTGATVTRVEFFQAVSDASVDSAPRAQARLQPAAAASAQVETVSAPAAPVAPTQTVRATPALAQPTLAQPALAQPALTQALTQAAPSAEPDGSALLGLDAAPATVEATPEQPAAAGSEELEANAQPSHDESSEHDDAAPQEQSSGGESADAKPQAQPVAPQVAFQPSDAHGMRGLDAIVASLLRTGAPEPEAAPSARGPAGMAQVELGKVETAKSESTKSAEKQSLESGLLKDRVLAREEERQNLREALEIEPAHPFHAEAKVDLQASEAPADAAPVPLPSPQLIQDPDAAMMGKIARGEGVNAAAISIDHPDFGAMDLVVENENGRIDVRAVLETPKAAAVMRAQESALRYGIQQAGMTFGALRVRSRGEEPTQLKARDNTKSSRRPGHEWEA